MTGAPKRFDETEGLAFSDLAPPRPPRVPFPIGRVVAGPDLDPQRELAAGGRRSPGLRHAYEPRPEVSGAPVPADTSSAAEGEGLVKSSMSSQGTGAESSHSTHLPQATNAPHPRRHEPTAHDAPR